MDTKMNFGASRTTQKPTDITPHSLYLQERLMESRSRHTRPKRVRQSDFGPRTTTGLDDDIFLTEAEEGKTTARLYDSSPMAPFAKYGSESGSSHANPSNAGRRRRTLGAKELDEQMDRLTKSNFDLKLELDHRREQQAKLQAQIESMRTTVERAEILRDEHTELLRINSQLVEELEKRDMAIKEAADMICELEEKVEDMEERTVTETRPSTAQADSGYAGTETHEQAPPSSPREVLRVPGVVRQPPSAATAASNQLRSALHSQTPGKPKREPSFLTQKKPSTNALREAFQATRKELQSVQSFNSILSKRTSALNEEGCLDDVLNSPRLSVLSESSFPSLYSPRKNISPERHAWEPEEEDVPDSLPRFDASHLRQDSISRVSRWIEDRHRDDATPSKTHRVASPLKTSTTASSSQTRRPSNEDRFQSLDDALSTATSVPDTETIQAPAPIRPLALRNDKSKRMPKTPTLFAGPIFGEPPLPPTPDSVSTRMLRASRSSVVDERSVPNTMPMRTHVSNALEAGLRTAPKQMRSSVELHGAYDSNVQFRDDGRGIAQTAYARAALDKSEDSDDGGYDSQTATVRQSGVDFDGYPDGNSIINGTPSRFFVQGKPTGVDMFFSDTDVSRTPVEADLRRRKSSSEAATSLRKPIFSRADTSPMFLSSLARKMSRSGPQSPNSSDSVTSPRSYHSGSSSANTAVQDSSERSKSRSLSPEVTRSSFANLSITSISPSKARPLASPGLGSFRRPSFTQKTHKLLRRLSNSHSDRERDFSTERREREISPLPTLTSTPSSAYVNTGRRDAAARPRTSDAMRSPSFPPPLSSGQGARPGSAPRRASKESSARPTLHARTRTEPAVPRVDAAAAEAPARRNPFKRGGSVRKVEVKESPATEARRGSSKDAAASSFGGSGKRPWR